MMVLQADGTILVFGLEWWHNKRGFNKSTTVDDWRAPPSASLQICDGLSDHREKEVQALLPCPQK